MLWIRQEIRTVTGLRC